MTSMCGTVAVAVALLLAPVAASEAAQSTTQATASKQAQKTKARTAPKAKPAQQQPEPFDFHLSPDAGPAKPPNYIGASQNNSIFRGTSVGSDSQGFPSGFGLDPLPGLR